ncbi:MAG: hypothetical protein DLM71_06460 [Chloroflexi bacterium]|nr:MAG: hypothetical protein DLM71_06460 [Chloroflexota bacterium]
MSRDQRRQPTRFDDDWQDIGTDVSLPTRFDDSEEQDSDTAIPRLPRCQRCKTPRPLSQLLRVTDRLRPTGPRVFVCRPSINGDCFRQLVRGVEIHAIGPALERQR